MHARRAGRLTVVWAVVILIFAVVPTHVLLSSTVGERETLTTEIGHFVEFAVLAVLALWWATERAAARPQGEADRRGQLGKPDTPWAFRAVAVWATVVAYGALIEVVQMPLAYRSAQFSDLAVDAAGALAGLLAFSCVRALRGRDPRARAR
jgi:hypothetical protein